MCTVVGFCFGSWKYCLLLLELWFLLHKKNLAPTPLVPHSYTIWFPFTPAQLFTWEELMGNYSFYFKTYI